MLRFYIRQVAFLLGMVCMAGLCTTAALADLQYIGGNTTNATANSVWNIGAKWIDPDGLYPSYMPDLDWDYDLQPDPSGTMFNTPAGTSGRHDQVEIERDIDDVGPTGFSAPRPGIRLHWIDGADPNMEAGQWGGDQKDYVRLPYPASGSPEQLALQNLITPAGCTFVSWTMVDWPSRSRAGGL